MSVNADFNRTEEDCGGQKFVRLEIVGNGDVFAKVSYNYSFFYVYMPY